MPTRGLLIVYTGNGKGKTTAALGLALRALGHGLRVCMIQFMKGKWKYGELESVRRFSDLLDFHVTGTGMTFRSPDRQASVRAALDAWSFAREMIQSARHHLVILDELTYLMKYQMVREEEIARALAARPDNMHVVITGRGAPQRLVEMADLVTEMREVAHPLKRGVQAQKGIEF